MSCFSRRRCLSYAAELQWASQLTEKEPTLARRKAFKCFWVFFLAICKCILIKRGDIMIHKTPAVHEHTWYSAVSVRLCIFTLLWLLWKLRTWKTIKSRNKLDSKKKKIKIPDFGSVLYTYLTPSSGTDFSHSDPGLFFFLLCDISE